MAIIGGGMGAAIAYAFLNSGVEVAVLETDVDRMVRASANIETLIGRFVIGRIDENAVMRNQLTLTQITKTLGR